MKQPSLAAALVLAALSAACAQSSSPDQSNAVVASDGVLTLPPKASCGPGSLPETGIQGRVSREDADSGRSALGYTCNTVMAGSYTIPDAVGTVGGFKVERYTDAAGHDCAFYDSTLLFPTNLIDNQGGVKVLDMTDPTHPVQTASLNTPAMLSPHESLVVSKQRGVLAAVLGNPAFSPVGIVDIYDISQDCRNPVLKASSPVGVFGHESGMAPDGKTLYSASPGTPTLTAIDISNLSLPVPMVIAPISSHGLTISADGNRAYVAAGSGPGPSGASGVGLTILDVSDIQSRKANPQMRVISHIAWESISIPQNAIPITIKGHPYLVEIDEYTDALNGGSGKIGAGRIIDIGDETHPKVISNLRLEVHQPANKAARDGDPGADIPVQGYGGHYCNVPTRTDPTIVACSMIISGLRVFDIRDPYHPKEVAYFNAPVNPRITPVFEASNWAMSSPSFVPERKEIWYTDGYSGFYAVRTTNGAWPDK